MCSNLSSFPTVSSTLPPISWSTFQLLLVTWLLHLHLLMHYNGLKTGLTERQAQFRFVLPVLTAVKPASLQLCVNYCQSFWLRQLTSCGHIKSEHCGLGCGICSLFVLWHLKNRQWFNTYVSCASFVWSVNLLSVFHFISVSLSFLHYEFPSLCYILYQNTKPSPSRGWGGSRSRRQSPLLRHACPDGNLQLMQTKSNCLPELH